MFKLLSQDIKACMERDPAARNGWEVAILYSGFHAVMLYRFSHWLWHHGMKFPARFLSQFGRWMTGIEIHPSAVIGSGFFIDHGHGVVIGATAEIGNNVTLYHDVTLGGVAPSVDSDSQRDTKRHPTLKDDVIVGSGAQILGPITVHECARVGANSVVVRDVPPETTVVGIPAKPTGARKRSEAELHEFQAYGTRLDLTDPMQKVADALLDKVQGLSMRVAELERQLDRAAMANLLPDDDEEDFDESDDDFRD
jgi:serine O-acetyltransferase